MWLHADCWIEIDPLPVYSAPFGTTVWWREHSAAVLAARRV